MQSTHTAPHFFPGLREAQAPQHVAINQHIMQQSASQASRDEDVALNPPVAIGVQADGDGLLNV